MKRLWPRQMVEGLVFRVAVFVSGWLHRHAKHRWYRLLSMREVKEDFASFLGVSTDTPDLLPDVYRSFKRKSPESLADKGFRGDTAFPLEAAGVEMSMPRWAEEIPTFLANQLSVHTRRAYETDLKQFFGFLEGRLAPNDLLRLKPQHVILYRKYMEEGRLTGKPMEKSTINRKLAVIKSFFNWLRANQLVAENPAQLVKGFPQTQESSLKGLSDEEARKMLSLPRRNTRSGALHSAILHTLLFMGLRKGELTGLRIGDVDEERGIPVLKVRGKGHRVRILPLTVAVREAIDHYFYVTRRDRSNKEEPLFTPTKNPRTKEMVKVLNPNAITYIVVRYARKAGILKPISPHSCRATCISNALDKKATHRSVQHLAGWSTPLMIQRYDKRREDLKNSAAFLVDYGDEEGDVIDAETTPYTPPPEREPEASA